MEVEQGAHCAKKNCHQLDFLPFQCNRCNEVFCLDHREYSSHGCDAFYAANMMPQCPLCGKYIQIAVNESPDEKVNEHISRGCVGGELSKPDKKSCSVKSCNIAEVMPVHCKGCKTNFCIRHRHPQDHNCPRLADVLERKQQSAAKKQQKKDLVKSKIKASLSSNKATDEKELKKLQRKQKSNARIQAMRIKLRAVGNKNVFPSDRFYFEIEFSAAIKKKSLSMWFNKRHTLGRAIDDICSISGVRNRNNVKGARKLCLYAKTTKSILPTDIGLELMEPEVSNGQTLVLAYEDEEEWTNP